MAKDKLKNAIDEKIVDQVVQAKMPTLPFADGNFDAVLFSLVMVPFKLQRLWVAG